MIIAFVIIYSYSIIVCRLIKRKLKPFSDPKVFREIQSFENCFEIAYDGQTYREDGELRFAPCVYIQRYIAVKDKLEQLGPFKKVVDLGCSELGFFTYLKHLEGIEEVVLVDQDEELLRQRCDTLKPLPIDHLNRRNSPLSVKVLCGNAAVADSNLADTSAVVAIELIEHMFPPDLNDLPFTLFGVVKPQVVIVTTPNYDFNCLFKLTGFRHFDHKFEWTRQQFKDWVENIVIRFPDYNFKLYGIGPGPEGTTQYGTCSQMVVFQLGPFDPQLQPPSHTWEESYQIISVIDYPYEAKVDLTVEENVKYDAERFIRYAVYHGEYSRDDRIEIPLSCIMRMVTRHTNSQEILQSVLEESGWTVESNEAGEKCVVLPLSGIQSSSASSRSEDSDNQTFVPNADSFFYTWKADNLEAEENWSDQDDAVLQPNSWLNPNNFSQNLPQNEVAQPVDLSKGCDLNESTIFDSCSSDKIYDSSKSSHQSSQGINDFSKNHEESVGIQNVPDTTNLSSNHEIINSLINCKSTLGDSGVLKSSSDFKSVNFVKDEVRIEKVSSGVSGEQRFLPDKTLSNDGVQEGNVVCSAGNQSKVDKESFDSFDECCILCNNSPKNDICLVKRSLDLPLYSIKTKYNGNQEGAKRYNDIKPPFEDISENTNYKPNSKVSKSGAGVTPLDFHLLSVGPLSDVGPSGSGGIDSVRIFLGDKDSRVSDLCKDRAKTNLGANQSGINRCLSLQHIKEKEGVSKSNRFSLCCEKENINISDIFKDGLKTKSCGHSFDEVIDLIRVDATANFDDSCSQSKAVDSGYPNTSDRDMDMDLTPEQVDEIVSENESSLDEREEEEERELGGAAAPVQIMDHVENGDVANNNRDDEGNNLDQDLGQALHFQQIILEEGNNPALDEAPLLHHHHDSDSESEEKFMSCASLPNESTLSLDDSRESEAMKTCLGWLHSSTPCPGRGVVWRTPDNSILERQDIASSSTSLEVHPPSSSLSIGTVEPFPSWLLEIEVDDAGDSHSNIQGDFPIPQELSDHSLLEEERLEVVREDILGGGEPHQQL